MTLVRTIGLVAWSTLAIGCSSSEVSEGASASVQQSSGASNAEASGPPAPAAPLSTQQREHLALDLLQGGPRASALPLHDVDEGKPFDPHLLEKVAPTRKFPTAKLGRLTVTGRLPPEVIQRILRQQRSRLITCYEAGLKQKPDLSGTVGISFVIKTDGTISQVQDAGSTLSDSGVRDCFVRALRTVSFPAPEGGVVKVQAPFELTPAG